MFEAVAEVLFLNRPQDLESFSDLNLCVCMHVRERVRI
jgi:hypothetical protein